MSASPELSPAPARCQSGSMNGTGCRARPTPHEALQDWADRQQGWRRLYAGRLVRGLPATGTATISPSSPAAAAQMDRCEADNRPAPDEATAIGFSVTAGKRRSRHDSQARRSSPPNRHTRSRPRRCSMSYEVFAARGYCTSPSREGHLFERKGTSIPGAGLVADRPLGSLLLPAPPRLRLWTHDWVVLPSRHDWSGG